MLENADNASVCPGRFSLQCWACWIENSQATVSTEAERGFRISLLGFRISRFGFRLNAGNI